jgi:prepilin-type processing-associated H-X9-DG protein
MVWYIPLENKIKRYISWMNCICFLTVRPNKLFIEFCEKLANKDYDVYICVDDNMYEVPTHSERIKIIKIDNKLCERHGFKGSVLWLDGNACSRDKALYYFCHKKLKYEYMWFIEEDVFIPTIHTIKLMDEKYKHGDLLSASHNIKNDRTTEWHWKRVFRQIRIPLPYASSMICAVRVSDKLLHTIHNYAKKYKNLFLDETLFNTLALHNKLVVITPPELSGIHFRYDWKPHEIESTHLYHPIKDIDVQYAYRNGM